MHHPVHIVNGIVKLPNDHALQCITFHDTKEQTVYIIIADKCETPKASPCIPENCTELYSVDRHLDLSAMTIARYLVSGKVEATIERYASVSSRIGFSAVKGAQIRAYVSGRVKIRASVRLASQMLICGSAHSLKIYSLFEDSSLDLTCFKGRVFGSEHNVCQQSIFCSAQTSGDVETTRQKFVREHIRVPDVPTVVATSSGDDACVICYEYKANVECLPCTHVCMCAKCAEYARTLEQSMFTCPVCRAFIDVVNDAT